MKIKKKNLMLLVFLFAAFFAVAVILSQQSGQIKTGPLKEITLVNSNNEHLKIYAEIADNDTARETGLSGREKIPENMGMLFIFDSEHRLGFWMPDMKFPLDMIFFDSNYKIVDIAENEQPCATKSDCPVYVSKPAKYVLEVNAGVVKKNKIKIGDSATIS